MLGKIKMDLLPEAERAPTQEILSLVGSLESYARRFEHAVDLFDFAEEQLATALHDGSASEKELAASFMAGRPMQKRMVSWTFCAAQWGSLQAFHFAKILEQVLAVRGRQDIKTLSSKIGKQELKVINSRFLRPFQHHEGIRNSVAHEAEPFINPIEHAKHATKTDQLSPNLIVRAGTLLGGDLNNRTYSCTVYGKIVTFDISRENADALHATVAATKKIFTDAFAALERDRGASQTQPRA